ncbi:hypothetical protein ZWY2020_005740 [Hordeum vulgare]|nr:hypothetical protein ZWY2020_005740 [Hordeum vulgare]
MGDPAGEPLGDLDGTLSEEEEAMIDGNQVSNSTGTSTIASNLSKSTTRKDRFYVDSGANIHATGLGINSVSVSKLNELDYMPMFVPNDGCSIIDTRTNELAGHGRPVSGLFELDYLRVPLDRA